jgi:hypothetical protein
MTRNCHDCGARPGALHEPDCDVERCPACGGQFISCGCPRHRKRRRLYWTGEWPGEAECREFGWYCKLVPGTGWMSCGADDPQAEPDINRLRREAVWDPRAGRFVRR